MKREQKEEEEEEEHTKTYKYIFTYPVTEKQNYHQCIYL